MHEIPTSFGVHDGWDERFNVYINMHLCENSEKEDFTKCKDLL